MSSKSPNKGVRPAALKPEHLEVLRAVVAEKPACSLEELRRWFVARRGVPVSGPTLRKALLAGGDLAAAPAAGAAGAAQWALAADLFAAQDARGRPPRYARRDLINAYCYVLRTGCAWRLLPKDFPPLSAVYKAFSRWAARGVFECFHDRLRAQWRERLGKHAAPTAAILNSQSTRISPQGDESGYDAGKKVKGRKRQCWSMPSACCSA